MTVYSVCRVAGSRPRCGDTLYTCIVLEALPRRGGNTYVWRLVRTFGPHFWYPSLPMWPPEPGLFPDDAFQLKFIPGLRPGMSANLSPVEILAGALS